MRYYPLNVPRRPSVRSDRSDLKSKEKSLAPVDAPVQAETPIDRAYLESPSQTIVKCLSQAHPTVEDKVTGDEFDPISSKDTRRIVAFPPSTQVPEFMSQSPKAERVLDPEVQIDVPEAPVEKPRPQPHYEYGSELRNEKDSDSAFQILLPQSVAESMINSDVTK